MLKLTSADLTRPSGVHRRTVRKLERCDTTKPQGKTIARNDDIKHRADKAAAIVAKDGVSGARHFLTNLARQLRQRVPYEICGAMKDRGAGNRPTAVLLGLAALLWAGVAGFAQEVHFAPEENLEAIDAALIDSAKRSIDLACYVITDRVIVDALAAAQRRGVALRIVLDPHEPHAFGLLIDLADHIRVRQSDELMHLKACVVDSAVVRSGSANFSLSGEIYQDNDLVIVRNRLAAEKFEAHFERMWSASQPVEDFAPAVKAFEPK